MSIPRAEDTQGIKDWIRLARSDVVRLCQNNHLGGDYVALLMREIIRDRAEAAYEDTLRHQPGLTPGQADDIKRQCLALYTALLEEVDEEKVE